MCWKLDTRREGRRMWTFAKDKPTMKTSQIDVIKFTSRHSAPDGALSFLIKDK